jgi:hypothetical protein
MAKATCLYCPEPGLSLEHVLPAAFGEFAGFPLLCNRICQDCNNRLGLLDEQLTRCGPEAFIRRYYNVTGRSGHESINPFYRGSAGGKRLEMKVFDPNLGFEILVERTDGSYRQLCQIVFIEQATRKIGHVPIPENMTPQELRAVYNRLNLTPPLDMYVICGAEEEQRVQEVIRATSPQTTLGPRAGVTTTYGSAAVISFGLTERYFRAVAKIGFHYFLSQFPEYTGHEPKFSDIRRFIAIGDRDVNRANEFVGERQLPLVGQALGGARPDGWFGHILCADVTNGEYRAHVQLFICEDFQPRIYSVRLGHSPIDLNNGAAGHCLVYFRDSHHGRFAGEAHRLTAARFGFPPESLAPVVRPSPPSTA